MILAVVQFELKKALDYESAKEIFLTRAEKYRNFEGLIRKNYILSEDGKIAGGIYLWKTKEASHKLYTQDWKNFIKSKYGKYPTINYFQIPVVVDNTQ